MVLERFKTYIETAEVFIKAVVIVLFALTLLAFILPPVERWAKIALSWRFGSVGYVYYVTDKAGDPRDLYKVTPGATTYEKMSYGDILQARHSVNFRAEGTIASRPLFAVRKEACLIVISSPDKPIPPNGDYVGGWLKVATTACGLFNETSVIKAP